MDNRFSEEVNKFIREDIKSFHSARLDRLVKLELDVILRRKNPYLFKAKNIVTVEELVKSLLDAHLSSQEEAIFGGFLERLALFVCRKVYRGKKSSSEGIDLEFEKDNSIYIVSIKSGPNWGNSSQIQKMKENFRKARKILRSNNPGVSVIAINGCCYGKDNHPDKEEYIKLCGQKFWHFISGEDKLYIELIEPLGQDAKKRNEEFMEEYGKIVNRFVVSFGKKYCNANGLILWDKLVHFNSGV